MTAFNTSLIHLVEGYMQATNQMVALLHHENEALIQFDFSEVKKKHPYKMRLIEEMAHYQQHIKEITSPNTRESLSQLPESVLEKLRAIGNAFQQETKQNQTNLQAANKTHETVIETIMELTQKSQTMAAPAYSAKGTQEKIVHNQNNSLILNGKY